MAAVKGRPALLITQNFPGGIEREDLLVIPSSVRVVLFHQLAVGRFDLCSGGLMAHPQNGVGIGHGYSLASEVPVTPGRQRSR